jgi:hypothetical protein
MKRNQVHNIESSKCDNLAKRQNILNKVIEMKSRSKNN